nr:alpha-1,4-glucan--maltose-1-phosphate maltosyltransferase [Derxia gummosa]
MLKPIFGKPILQPASRGKKAALAAAREPRIIIEALDPDAGPDCAAIKRCVGDTVTVEADIYADGHDKLAARILWRATDSADWQSAPLALDVNDRWRGSFPLERLGRHEYMIEAWWDRWATLADHLARKRAAGVPVGIEVEEARQLLHAARAGASSAQADVIDAALDTLDRLVGPPASAGARAHGKRRGAREHPAPARAAALRMVEAGTTASAPVCDADPTAVALAEAAGAAPDGAAGADARRRAAGKPGAAAPSDVPATDDDPSGTAGAAMTAVGPDLAERVARASDDLIATAARHDTVSGPVLGAASTLDLAPSDAELASGAHAWGDAPAHPDLAAKPPLAIDPAALDLLLSAELAAVVHDTLDRAFLARVEPPVAVDAERPLAHFASWYELFPRSITTSPERHGTFADVITRLPAIRDMGFDVLYFPPIHPIGLSHRKGRNNSLVPAPDDPGSPYAIGSEDGGHDAIHPELGTLDDFRHLRDAAADHGLELALDFAIQCSPDHPWLRQHPGWFDWRPDGTIKHAENPPKKYEDIVNVDFYAADAMPDLWIALRDVVLFWVKEGVKIFRVDNPHTKPIPFWRWLIAEVRGRHPDVIFLSEAFTRPKPMYRLGKAGFTQGYTYFTWRHTKQEFIQYLTELATPPVRDVFRPNFFVNTPDINPKFLHDSGRAGFLIRAALAATLSGLWGMFAGFELCEAAAVPGKEEYLDSDKYEIRPRDWNAPGNIIAEITALNRVRRENPAFHTHTNARFLNCWNDNILYFAKATEDMSNFVLVAINLDPHHAQEADFEIPLWLFDLPDHASLAGEDLMTGHKWTWTGKVQHMRLDPWFAPYGVWRVTRG